MNEFIKMKQISVFILSISLMSSCSIIKHKKRDHTKPLIIIENEENQINIFEDIIKMKLSVRETEELCKIFKNIPYNENETNKKEINLNYINIKNSISEQINSKTEITVNKKGNGKITIYFNNLEDLKRIRNKIQ